MTIADRIDILLRWKGLSRRQLAIKAGIPPSSFQSAMEREGVMGLDMLRKISNALELPMSCIIGQPPFDNFPLLYNYKGVILHSLEKNGYCDESITTADLSNYDYIKLIAEHITNIEERYGSGLIISYKSKVNARNQETVNFSTACVNMEFGEQQINLLCAFNLLNENGRKTALERVEELGKIPDYQMPKPSE